MRRIVAPTVAAGVALLCSAGPCFAQFEANLEGMSDANVQSYLAPLHDALGSTLNSAVFKTGYVPPNGFTFTIGAAAMAVGFEDADRVYTPTDPEGFKSLETTKVPTIIGDPNGVTVAGEDELTMGYPGGLDLSGFEVAVPQISVGSVAGTRVIGRFIAVDVGDSDLEDLSYWGAGVQHSITQWIPTLPVDLAAGAFVHRFEIGNDLLDSTAWLFNLTASREFGILQPYVGIGYETISSTVKAEDEDLPEESIDLTLERENTVHFTAGAMLKIPGVAIFGEYNAAAGSGFAIGLDFGK